MRPTKQTQWLDFFEGNQLEAAALKVNVVRLRSAFQQVGGRLVGEVDWRPHTN